MNAPAHQEDVAEFDEQQKRLLNDFLDSWARYRQYLASSSREYQSSVSAMYQEALAYKRGNFKQYYPYQDYAYKCDACDKLYLKSPDVCPNCSHRTLTKINEGVAGLRVFAAMIHTTGPGYSDWKNEAVTDDAVRTLPYKQRMVLERNYLDSDLQQVKAEKERLTMRTYQEVLYQAKIGVYMYLRAKGIIGE